MQLPVTFILQLKAFNYIVPIGHGNLFWLVLKSHGKVMENDYHKRVVTLIIAQLPLLTLTLSLGGLQERWSTVEST